MIRLTEIRLPLDHTQDALRDAVLARLGIGEAALRGFTVFRRAVDARRKAAIVLTYTIDVEAEDEAGLLARHAASRHVGPTPDMTYRFPDSPPPARRPVVVGTGPCGLFAALILAQAGLRPLILERGKVVRERTKDTWALWRRGVLTSESNVQFGEGGAGTFSDGKLYSQISDPNHLGRKVLTEFVAAGAPEEIL
ncbi:MAG: FAD-dependent monooxygenase, partial [Rhodospirillales bacterium]|nr:FAD-dependent monooxygenase [Rhodospirillales bacterium]